MSTAQGIRIRAAVERLFTPKPGERWIYFIEAGSTLGPVKIGIADDLDKRLKTLQAGNPQRLRVLAAFPGDVACERRLHERFAAGRLEGEWFRHDTPGLDEFMSDVIHFEGFPEDVGSLAVQAVLAWRFGPEWCARYMPNSPEALSPARIHSKEKPR